jgi:2-polyprenyl-6-methoxyphenol hydroxylase-like FAD-dependent oxidoreductase
VLLRTQELEAIFKQYAQELGVLIHYSEVKSANTLRDEHPECEVFVGADGAHSVIRRQIFGDEYRIRKDLHHVVELKYEVAGRTRPLDILTEHYRSIKLMPSSVFEYVGRERNSLTPITLRFFVAKNVYDQMGTASFKHPVTIENYQQRLPPTLSESINLYLTIRKELLGDDPMFSTMRLGKLTLSIYGSTSFSASCNHAYWYLAGDAAMGVPFFRSLNAGLLCGARLAQLLSHSSEALREYNSYASRRLFIEQARARVKSAGIHLHAAFVRASSLVPWQVNKWRRKEIEHYMQQLYESEASADSDAPAGAA